MDAFSLAFNSSVFNDLVASSLFTFGATLGVGEPGTIWSSSGGLAAASITVTYNEFAARPSAVPVPAAVWLFGTALIGLFGFGKRKSRLAA
jgi:hypothetical protein